MPVGLPPGKGLFISGCSFRSIGSGRVKQSMLFDPMGLRVVEGSRLPLGAWVRAWLAVGRGGPVTGASWWIRVCRWKSVWGGVVVDQGVSVEVCVGCGLRMPPFPGTVSPLLACGPPSLGRAGR